MARFEAAQSAVPDDTPVSPVESARTPLQSVTAAPRQDRAGAVAKRAFDIAVGSLLSILAVPLVLAAAGASAVVLRAWPFFVQDRPGLDAVPFRIVKIRTLPKFLPTYEATEDVRPIFAQLPRVCRFLRETHLDELPQLALVPLGRMSLVGPRPSLPLQYEHIDEGFERLRTSVRPGCTGLWQIGAAHDHAQGDDPEYDRCYIANRSMRMDLWVLFRTALFMVGLARPLPITAIPRWVLSASTRARRATSVPQSRRGG
jgi:lipopolysaccharide/colanic/teichoic acid biosynthesis glycosyltransferase